MTEFWEEWEGGELYHVYRVDDHLGFDLPRHDPDDFLVTFALGSTYGPFDPVSFLPVEGNRLYETTARITIKSVGICAYCGDFDPPRVDYLVPLIESPSRPSGPGVLLDGSFDDGVMTVDMPADELAVWPGGGPHTGFMIYPDWYYRTAHGHADPRPGLVGIDWIEIRYGPLEELPIVLAHGWDSGPDMWIDNAEFYQREIRDFEHDDIDRVQLNPGGSIVENASLIGIAVDRLKDEADLPQVNIVAHSKGGLDSRLYAFRHPENVKSLTMLATPNAGSGLADLLCGVQFGAYYFNFIAANILSLLLQAGHPNHVCNSIDSAIFQLTTPHVALFNLFTPDAASVRYSTIAGSGDPGDWRTGVVGAVLGEPNDAAVSVASVQAMAPPAGRQIPLGIFPRSHETITEPGTPATILALCTQYPSARICEGAGSAAANYSRLSTRASAMERSMDLHIPQGMIVDAGRTVEIPIEVSPDEPATIIVFGDVEATWGAAALRRSSLMGMPILLAAIEEPRGEVLRIINSTDMPQPVVAAVAVETDRPLVVTTNQPVYSPGDVVHLSVDLEGRAVPTAASTVVVDHKGNVVARPPLTRQSGEQWVATFEPTKPGNYSITVALEGAESRLASTMIAVGGGAAAFTGSFVERPEDFNNNRLYDRLVIDADIDVRVAGTYQIGARLQSPSGETITAAGGLVELMPGTQQVELVFDGRDIFGSGISGPYRIVHAAVATEDMSYESIVNLGATSSYSFDDFEHDQIALDESSFTDRAVDDNNDGLHDRLVVAGKVRVAEVGTYLVRGRLAALDGSGLASTSTRVTLEEGENDFELSFSWEGIRFQGIDGPWLVRDVQVSRVDLHGSLRHLVDAHLTLPYQAAGGESVDITFEQLREMTVGYVAEGAIIDRDRFLESLITRLHEGEILLAMGDRSGASSRLRTYVHRLTVAHPRLVSPQALEALGGAAERVLATFGRPADRP